MSNRNNRRNVHVHVDQIRVVGPVMLGVAWGVCILLIVSHFMLRQANKELRKEAGELLELYTEVRFRHEAFREQLMLRVEQSEPHQGTVPPDQLEPPSLDRLAGQPLMIMFGAMDCTPGRDEPDEPRVVWEMPSAATGDEFCVSDGTQTACSAESTDEAYRLYLANLVDSNTVRASVK